MRGQRRWRVAATVAAALLVPALPVPALPGPAAGASAEAAAAAPQHSRVAAAVLRHLTRLPIGSGDRVISGSFGHYGEDYSLDGAQEIRRVTGRDPGLLGCDYRSFVATLPPHINADCNRALIRHSRSGGLATVSVHFPAPGTPGHELTDPVVLADLWRPGTAAHRDWIGDATRPGYLPQVATGLRQLRDAGVPVLFRPFHEMNGDWFWWGSRRPTEYIDLWRRTHAYLSGQGLDNLIWVYAANHGVGRYTDYYPGASYTDIVGLDAYLNDPAAAQGYTELLRLGKPFAFTEIGPDNAENRPGKGQFDYQRWIDAIVTKFPRTTYFLAWNKDLGPEGNRNATGLMNHPWVMNHGEIDLSTEPWATNFEGSTAGWTGWNVAAGPWFVTEWSAESRHSLKADVDLSRGETYLGRVADRDLRGRSALRVSVRHAEWGAYAAPMTAKLYIRTGAGATWYDGGTTVMGTGTTQLTLALAAVPDLGDVREVGVAFTPAPGSTGVSAVYVDDLRGDRVVDDFELGAAGWSGGEVEGGPWSVDDWAATGEHSLKAHVELARGEAYLRNAQARDLRGHRRLSVTVRQAGALAAPMSAKVYVRTGPDRIWYDGGAAAIGAGPTTLTLDLGVVADPGRAVEVGVAFTPAAGSTEAAAIFLDAVTLD